MSCGRTNRNCNRKSCQRYYNTTPQPFIAGQTLQLTIAGSKVVDSGISIETEPMSYTTVKTGLYHFAGDVVIESTAAGNITMQIYMDGVPLPCTFRESNLAATGFREMHTETDLELGGCCCDVNHTFTFVLTSADTAAGSVVHFCSGITKLQ